jgi:hypothetical protein
MESLTRVNASIFVYVLERVRAAQAGHTWHFDDGAGGRAQAVGASRLEVDPSTSVVFTLGGLGRRVIVTLTDAEPARMAPLLARIEREAPAEPAAVAFPLEDAWATANGRAGVALLPPSATRFFPKLPDALLLDEGALHVSTAVFLAPEELTLGRAEGVAALAERFRIAGRDLVRFAHRARP